MINQKYIDLFDFIYNNEIISNIVITFNEILEHYWKSQRVYKYCK